MNRFSIKVRIVVLSLILLTLVVVETVYNLVVVAHEHNHLMREEQKVDALVDSASIADSAFEKLRYWQSDLAASLLLRSERNAEAARVSLNFAMENLAAVAPDTVVIIRPEIEAMNLAANRAVEAYTADQRVQGNSFMSEGRIHMTSVEAALHKLIDDSPRRSRTLASDIEKYSQSSGITSIIVLICGILIGAVATFVVLRSIIQPLAELDVAMSAISNGDLAVDLPKPGSDEIGAMARTLSLFRDSLVERDRLTAEHDRLKAEELNHQIAKEKAEQASKAKSDFLSSMSHELRTPLNAIIGFGTLLELEPDGVISAENRQSVEQIVKGGNHLLALINQILDLGQIESGLLKISAQDMAPDATIRDCLDLVGPIADSNQVNVKVNHQLVELPAIHADPTRLQQILLNLLINATKYNIPGGHVGLTCVLIKKGFLRFIVEDDGPGIPSDKHEAIFTPFNRLGAEARGIEGTGIGLTIAKQLALQMDGEMGFQSNEGEGATFWFDLPLAKKLPQPA